VFIKVLYAVLVVCVGAVVGAAIAGYFRIRRHMNRAGNAPAENPVTAPRIKEEIRR
jgi:hypothetical protein